MTGSDLDVTIKCVTAIDSTITSTLSVAGGASPAQVTLALSTSYGSAKMAISFYGAIITPNSLAMFPGTAVTLSASLTPSAPQDYSSVINKKNPGVIVTPTPIVIPAGGNSYFTVIGLEGGTGTIQIVTHNFL